MDAWGEKFAVQDVIVTYCDAATRGDWDRFESLFTDDAVYEVIPPRGAGHVYGGERSRSVGARQIRESSEAAVAALEFFVQVTYGSVVSLVGGDRATATTTVHALARRVGGGDYLHYAIYYDELVKRPDGWKFTNRLLQPVYFQFEPLPGEAAIARAELR